MSGLHELLRIEAVRTGVEAEDWRAAIVRAGELLTGVGIADAAYTQAMIATVEEHGPYIVIAPGFAFAHSRPDASVHRTGMSLVHLAEPVAFGHAKNDPVSLVLALAAVDGDAHREALAQLARILSDPERRARLDAAADAAALHAALGEDSANGAPAEDDADTGDAEANAVEATAANPATAAIAGAGGPAESHLIYTVCGNGLGTSLFLKSTLEKVLDTWGWGRFVRVEATDTISARGRAGDAQAILTSGEIARTLGEVPVPVEIVDDFSSPAAVDAALRRIYAV